MQNVYHILAGIDLSLEDAKKSGHMETTPSFIQDNNNVKSNEGAEVKSQGPHSHILMTGVSEGFFWV